MHKISLTILMFFLILHPLFAQDEIVMPLKKILSDIEIRHQVRFNFLDKDIANISIRAPKKSDALRQKIDYLAQITHLSYDFITAKSISISALPEETADENEVLISKEILTEVLIPNYIAKGISKKIDGSYVVLPQKFGILPGLTEADVLQTMQQLPGIISIDETISNINVRGGTHDQNLFTWNGVRMFQTGHFFGLISAFSPMLTQEIKIYKNGTSAFLGESVSSAAVISTSEKLEKSTFGFGVNLISAEFFAKIKASEKSSLTLSGRRSFTDLATTPTYRNYANRIFQNTVVTNLTSNENVQYTSNEQFYFYDFTAQYVQQISSRSDLTLNLIAIANLLDVSQNKSDRIGTTSRNSDLNQQNYGGNMAWKSNWNAKNTTIVQGYASYYNLDATNRAVENDQILIQQNTVLDTGIKVENTHQFAIFTFSNGYQYNEIGIANYDDINTPALSRKIKNVLRSHAIILETQFHFSDRKALLKAGLRTNYFEKFNVFLAEPRLQFNYALTNKFSLEVLGELKSQTSSQIIDLQQDFLGLEKRRWTLADNAQNPIQKSNQIAVGFIYKNKGWLFTLDNFYKNVRGISGASQAFTNQLEFTKMNGDYTVFGSELLAQKNFRNGYTWLSYSFNNNKYDFEKNAPPIFPNNFEVIQTISWAGIYEMKKLKFALGSKWHSGRPETTPQNFNQNVSGPVVSSIDYNDPNNSILPDYLEFSFSAFYKLERQHLKWELGFSIRNLLNKQNILNRYYRVGNENSIESVNTLSMQRTPNISLKATF